MAAAASLALLPKGLSLFAALLLLASALSLRSWPRALREQRGAFIALASLPLLVLVVTITSMYWTGQGWRTIDNPARLLLLPWCALLAYLAAPTRNWLWVGALAAVASAFVMAVAEGASGMARAGGGSNPIVFANAVLAMLVLVVYARPAGRGRSVLLATCAAFALGAAAILLSGSRGVLPGLALVLIVALYRPGRRRAGVRVGLSLGLIAVFGATLALVPGLSEQARLPEIGVDLEAYAKGDIDSPVGARLQFLTVAAEALRTSPWTGVGIDRFDTLVMRLPQCAPADQHVCTLGHAHNDMAQWGATLGLPGLFTLLALYLVPLVLFTGLIRASAGSRERPLGAAWAGAMLVVVTFLSGLTQSMFSHALSATLYAALVGLLAGLALREAGGGGRVPAGEAPAHGRDRRVGPD